MNILRRLRRMNSPGREFFGNVNAVFEKPDAHPPLEITDGAPLAAKIADPIKHCPADQQLGYRSVNAEQGRMQQSVIRCEPLVLSLDERLIIGTQRVAIPLLLRRKGQSRFVDDLQLTLT